MCTQTKASAIRERDDNVSPYLRRPVRTYEEFRRDQADDAATGSGTPTNNSPQTDTDDVEPHS